MAKTQGKSRTSVFQQRMGKMQANYEASKENRFGGKFPDGTFRFQLQELEGRESRSSKGDDGLPRLFVYGELYCMEGENVGKIFRQNFMVDTDGGLSMLCQFLEDLGGELPEEAKDLEEAIAEVADRAPIIQGTVSTSDRGFQNLRVDRLLQESAEKAERESGGDDDGDSATEGQGEESDAEEAITREWVADATRDQLAEVIDAYGLSVEVPQRVTTKKREEVLAALVEEGVIEEEEEEEPADGGSDGDASQNDAPPALSADDCLKMEPEALAEAVKDFGLDVKVPKKLTKKRRDQIIIALDEAGAFDAPAEKAPVQAKSGKAAAGKPAAPAKRTLTRKKKESEGPSVDELRELAATLGVTVEDDADRDAVVTAINLYEYQRSELTDDEVAMLESIGADLK